MKYVLVLILSNMTFASSIEFDSKETCDNAKKEIISDNSKRRLFENESQVKAYCLPK